MIKHVVLLNWNDQVTDEAITKVSEGFAVLRDEIAEIVSYEFGPDLSIYKGNADYALIATFENQQDLETYSVHPKHLSLLKELTGPILGSYMSAQFEM